MTEAFSMPAWHAFGVSAGNHAPPTDAVVMSDMAAQPISEETLPASAHEPGVRADRPRPMSRAMARCRQSRQRFYLSLEAYAATQWIVKTAFTGSEIPRSAPGGRHHSISGSFTIAPTYPGCPHCQADRLFQCSCGDLSCWDGSRHAATCPACSCIGERGNELENLSVDM